MSNEYDDLIAAQPAQESNEYDTALALYGDQQRTKLRGSLAGAVNVNPDEFAKATALSRKTGVPAEVVHRNMPEVNQAAKVNEYDTMLQSSPALRQQMTDLNFARMAHDDIANAGAIEQTLKTGWRAVRNLGAGLGPDIAQGVAGLGQAGAEGLSRFIGDPLARWDILPADPFADMAQWFAKTRQTAVKQGETVAGLNEGAGRLERDLYGGVRMLGQNTPALAAAVVTGQPELALGAITGQVGGTQYGEARDQGVPVEQALPYAASQAAIQLVASKLPVGTLFKNLNEASPLYKTFLQTTAAAVPAQVAATFLSNVNEWANLHPDKSFSDLMAEQPSAMLDTLLQTVVMTGGEAGLGAAARYAGNRQAADRREVANAKTDAANLEQLTAQAAESKLRVRDQQSFKQFVDSAAADGPVQDVYVDARQFAQTLEQSGVDPREVARRVPSVAEQLPEALGTGGDLRIPIGEYATHVAPEEYAKALLPHLRTSPDALSAAEAQTFEQSEAERFKADATEAMTAHQENSAFQESAGRVEQHVFDQLSNANRFTGDVNRGYAQMVRDFYAVQAHKLGVTPEEMFAKYPLNIKAESVVGDRQLDQAGKTEENDPYGLQELTRYLGDGDTARGRTGAASGSGAERGNQAGATTKVFRGSEFPLEDSHFNATALGKSSGNPSSGIGVWFSSSRTDAAKYGPLVSEHQLDLRNPKTIKAEELPAFDSLQDAQRFAKQLRAQGHDGVIMDASHLGGPKQYIVFSPESVADTKVLYQEARGQITFARDLSQPSVISLLRNADLSTFLHESGHFFLEVYSDIASREGAPESIKADTDALLKWFGVKDLATWRDMPLEQKRESHEKFARGFEAYLFDGKAPNAAMQSVFSRFRSWLLNVYKSLTNLHVDLTLEVRGVFDRMLATDQQIQVSEAMRAYKPLFADRKQAGMTEAEWRGYQEIGQQATEDARDELQKRSLRDMKWASGARSKALKELQAAADEKRKATRAEVAAEVQNEPIYRAQKMLRSGKTTTAEGKEIKGFKLSTDAVREMTAGDKTPDQLRGMTSAEGLHPEMVAEMFGFHSGDELIRRLMEAEPLKDVIDAGTDQRMLERYGDLTDPVVMGRAADAAVHNEARSRFVATELRALERGMKVRERTPKGGTVNVLASAARQFAEITIGRKRVRDIKPAQFDAAETRAAQASEKATRKGDFNAAIMEKRNQLINGYASRAAHEALKDVEKGLDYLNKFDRAAVRDKIDLEYRDQIDALLDRFDLRKSVTGTELKKREALVAFVDRMSSMGYEPSVPEYLLNEANRQHYKDMAVEQFRGLVDSVKSIEHLGRLKGKLLDLQEERELNEVATEAADTMEKLPQVGAQGNRGLTRIEKKWAGAKSAGRSLGASLLKMEQMMDWLDARNPNGVFNRVAFRRIADAGGREMDMQKAMSDRFKGLVHALPDGALKGTRVYVADGLTDSVTGQPAKFTKKELLALAGNVGNESNLQKMLAGEGWKEAALWDFLHKNLTKADWDFVQGVGEAFESLWPEKLAMSRRLGNTNPEKIEPRSFTTPHGEYQGWYWPMIYDPVRSQDVAERGARQGEAMFENIYRRANTDTGRMNTRVETYARPVLFDLDAIPRVIKDEIHDIAYREAIIDADKLLSHKDVRAGIIKALGPEYYEQLRPWLQSVANDKAVDGAALKFWQGLAHGARTRATMAGLGFRLTTMLVHGTSAGLESVAELGPKWFTSGLADFRNPLQWAANKDFVFERSAEMRNRMKEVDRDIREHLREIDLRMSDPATGAVQRGLDKVKANAYMGIAMLDMASALPTWMGAYKRAMTDTAKGGIGMGEADAVYFADKTVRNAHGGTGAKDLAAVQRGNEFFKLFTMFYSFWNHNVNRLRDTARLAGSLAATARSGNMKQFRGDLGLVIMRTLIYTLGIQVLHSAMHPDKGDENWGVWAAKQLAASATSGIPVVRDIAAHFLDGRDYSVTPAAKAVETIGQNVHDAQWAAMGRTTDKWIKHAGETAGYVFGLPTGQAAATGQFLWDVADGHQQPDGLADWWNGVLYGDIHHH